MPCHRGLGWHCMKAFLSALFLASLLGCAHGQPSAIERTIYDVRTSIVAVVVLKTNYVIAPGTTNLVPISIVPATNYAETYQLEPKQSVTSGIVTASGVAGTFGIGWAGALGTLLAMAYGGWAEYRNSRKKKTLTVFGQNIETAREVMKLQPGGAATEARFMDSVKSEQVKAGVKSESAEVANNRVDTREAKETAASVSKPTIA